MLLSSLDDHSMSKEAKAKRQLKEDFEKLKEMGFIENDD